MSESACIFKQPKRIVRRLAARFPLPFLGVCIFGKGGDKVSTFVPAGIPAAPL